MNWTQLHTISTPDEREQITYLLFETIDLYTALSVRQYHFVGAPPKNKKSQVLYLSIFMFILITVSVATWLVSLNVPPAYGAPLVFSWAIVPFVIWILQVFIYKVRNARTL